MYVYTPINETQIKKLANGMALIKAHGRDELLYFKMWNTNNQ